MSIRIEHKPTWWGVFISMMILMIGAHTYIHEITHGVVFEGYGCRNIHYGFEGWNAITYANCSHLSETMYASMKIAQSNVESFQYQMPLFLILLILLIFPPPLEN